MEKNLVESVEYMQVAQTWILIEYFVAEIPQMTSTPIFQVSYLRAGILNIIITAS
jgi:hypothetical protein